MFILWHTHIISETVIYLLAIIHQLSACLSETTLKPWVNVGSSSSLDDLKLEVQTSSWKLLQASRLCSLRPLDAQAVKIQSQSSWLHEYVCMHASAFHGSVQCHKPISSMCSSLLRTVFAGVQRLALTHTQFWLLMMGRLVGGATWDSESEHLNTILIQNPILIILCKPTSAIWEWTLEHLSILTLNPILISCHPPTTGGAEPGHTAFPHGLLYDGRLHHQDGHIDDHYTFNTYVLYTCQ